MYKIIKMCIKSDFEEIILKPTTYGQRANAFLTPSKLCPHYVVCPCLGLYTFGKHEKMCIKSDFRQIVLILATNGRSGKGFLLTSTFVPKEMSAPEFGLYTCIKALKYKPGPGTR